MIKLKALDTNLVQSFEIGHAEQILRLPNSQWVIADNEKYEYKDNAIIRRADKKSGGEATIAPNKAKGDKASK